MNQITFPRTAYDGSETRKDELEQWYCNGTKYPLVSLIGDELNKITSATTCLEKRLLTLIKWFLPSILIASPQRLQCIVKIFDKCLPSDFFWHDTPNGIKRTPFYNDLFCAFNYEGYRDNKLRQLAAKLNIKSCPYCNMHYTLFAEEGEGVTKMMTKFQYDHFFDKAEYPFLCMSLYNLIPSCGVCNQGKSKGHLSLRFHPYVTDISSLFHFEVKEPKALYSGAKKDKIALHLVADTATPDELQQYEKMFHLQMLYRRHGDIAQEVFDKAYEEPYYTDADSFSFLKGVSLDYLQRLTYGVYLNKEDIDKRPMNKYIQDLRKQALQCRQAE